MLTLTPDFSVPYMDPTTPGFVEAACAAANTTELLAGHGLEIEYTQQDLESAREAAIGAILKPEQQVPDFSHMRPATVVIVKRILQTFCQQVAVEAQDIRNLIMNKLIIETESRDPKIRLRALELLGKTTEVAMFTERAEVTINHRATDDLKRVLQEKLNGLTLIEDAVYEEIKDDEDIKAVTEVLENPAPLSTRPPWLEKDYDP